MPKLFPKKDTFNRFALPSNFCSTVFTLSSTELTLLSTVCTVSFNCFSCFRSSTIIPFVTTSSANTKIKITLENSCGVISFNGLELIDLVVHQVKIDHDFRVLIYSVKFKMFKDPTLSILQYFLKTTIHSE